MKIFLSAVWGQSRECRQALASDLRAMGAEVKVQEDFQPHGQTELEALEECLTATSEPPVSANRGEGPAVAGLAAVVRRTDRGRRASAEAGPSATRPGGSGLRRARPKAGRSTRYSRPTYTR